MKFAYALFVLAATAGYVVNGESYFRGANRRRLAGCKTWPSSSCLYNPWNENKFGDHNRVQTRYYNGHHIGRFDEDDDLDRWNEGFSARRHLAGCKTWPSSSCLYNPWNENKFGDHNRVQTRYYNGHHIGRFDEDDEVDFLPFFEQSDEDDSIGHRPTKKCRSSAARHTECN